MTLSCGRILITLVFCCWGFAGASSAAQQEASPGVPVKIVITLEPKRGKTVPAIDSQDLTVHQGKDRRPVTGLAPLQDADTQLLLLIDDSARSSFGTEIPSLKQFVTSLPPHFAIGIAYMRNGMSQFTQNFTTDHAAAANTIRLPNGSGGADVSPYDSLTDAVTKWPRPGATRKEVLMISSGVEGLGGGFNSDNPYVNAGIRSALQAGVMVYSIYNPSVGHAGHSFWRASWGQNFLSQLSDATGAESYIIGFGTPVSFEPFLKQFLDAQAHQFLLSFMAKPEQKSGLQPFRVSIESKDASINAPDKVYVKAGL